MKKVYIKERVMREAPLLLNIGAVGGFVTGAYMAVKATPKANEQLAKYKAAEGRGQVDVAWDKFKILLPIYGPAVGVFVISTAFIIGSQEMSSRRRAAIGSLLATTQNKLYRWQEETLQTAGPKVMDEIRANTLSPTREPEEGSNAALFINSVEHTVCYDAYSDRYFTVKSVEELRQKITDLNQDLYTEGFVGLNDMFYALGLPAVEYGELLGWGTDSGPIDIQFSPAFVRGTKETCVSVEYTVEPRYTP